MPTLTWPYVHLLINHFPVVLTTMAVVAALGAMLTGRRGLWLYAMGTMTVAGLAVYPVHFTGDEADHALRHPWYIAHDAIDVHDNAAGIAMFVVLIAGAISAYAWWRTLKRRDEIIPAWIRIAVVVGTVAGFGTIAWTSYLGGKIIHEAPVLALPTAPPGLPPGIATPPGDSAHMEH